jgi:hypothetical protein
MLELALQLEDYLVVIVLSYIIPTIYIPLERILLSTTGKIDYRALCKLGDNLTIE